MSGNIFHVIKIDIKEHNNSSVSFKWNAVEYKNQDMILIVPLLLLALLYMRVGILLTRGKHLHDRVISLRGEV